MLPPLNLLIDRDNYYGEDNPMRSFRQAPTALFLTGMVLLAIWPGSIQADGLPRLSTPDADTARLVEEVLRKASTNGEDSLGAWTRWILDRALDRTGESARQTVPGRLSQTAPLPAERHAGEITGPRSGAAEVLIFTSLFVPVASWRQWAHDAGKTGAPLVLRGVGDGGLPGTAKRIGDRLGVAEAGVAIDPRLFRLFGVTRVPAVVVVPDGAPACRSRGCTADPAPPHDRIAGNIGLIAALEAIAEEGAVARAVARRHLERLRGGDQP